MRKAFSKLTALLPIAALMGGLSLAAVSCSDDELSEEEKQQQAEEQAEQGLDDAAEFWNVVGQLTDDPMPDEGWQTATYAPSIGEPDGTNTAVRIVATNDAETAAARFAMLTGADIDESTTDYTYQNEHVGTLRYHRTGGQSLAVVDVNIKQMPGLSQIIYQAPEGDNGYFNGTAYYRFGDVVKKLNSDGAYDYWICVRPAFGPAKKGDSHWISVSKIPSANTKQVTKIINKEKVTHSLPKSLTTNREHMQNLAEMLYAMTNASQWSTNLSYWDGYKTLKYFRDFNYVQLFKYNDNMFFNRVNGGWIQNNLYKKIFGLTGDELETELVTNGLNLVYSSATMSGNKILLPVATYNGTNLKTETLAKTNSEWTTAFDIQTLMNPGYISYNDATGRKQKAWLVRYATGATLCKGSQEAASFDKYKRLTNCEDVFVYNKHADNLDMNNLKNIEPRTLGDGFTGRAHYKLGSVYKDENGHRWFVVYMSGQDKGNYTNPQGQPEKEETVYSELVCFEGLTASADRTHVTNLPTLDQTIRGFVWMQNLFGNNVVLKTDAALLQKLSGHVVYNIKENAGVDLRTILQMVVAKSGNPRNASHIASLAYRDPQVNDKQPLMRMLFPIDLSNEEPPTYLRTLYVNNPDSVSETYPFTQFTSERMYLQDIADAAKVKLYAKDFYACQPIYSQTGGDDVTRRMYRTQTDQRALDVTNYYYNRALWDKYEYLTDMWNEPILMFRCTAVYDRGDDDYSTVTVDGHTLTLVKEIERLTNPIDEEDYYENISNLYTLNTGQIRNWQRNTNFLNGMHNSLPAWKYVW